MQREIKFRAWKDGAKPPHCSPQMFPWERLQSLPMKDLEREDMVWMQFIGLKDKNGKEIYEGDIVKGKCLSGFACDDADYRSDKKVRDYGPYVVTFTDGVFWPREHFEEVEDGYYSFRVFDLEVIGNRFEHPHLLEKV